MSTPPHAAPLPRAWLDALATPIRVLFGLIFIAWSWISTVIILGTWLYPLLPGSSAQIAPDWFLVALSLALFVSLAEFISSGRWPVAYWLVLLFCDAPFTIWQTRAWLLIIVEAQTEIAMLGQVIIGIVSVISGIIVAKLGEVLLFGRR